MRANEDYLKRLVQTLQYQTKAQFREQFTGLGGGAYSEFFWRRVEEMSAETLGRVVSCANEEDLERSERCIVHGDTSPTKGVALLRRVAHAVLYRQHLTSVFGKKAVT